MRGGSIGSVLRSLLAKARSGRYISRGATALGRAFNSGTLKKVGSIASQLGLGKPRPRRRRPVRRTMRGRGFFGDLWSGIKKGVRTVAPAIRTGLSMLPGGVGNVARAASPFLSQVGLGRKRRRRKMRGGSIGSMLRSAYSKLKSGRYISRGATALGRAFNNNTLKKVGSIAAQFGLGRRRRRTTRRRTMRGGSVQDIYRDSMIPSYIDRPVRIVA